MWGPMAVLGRGRGRRSRPELSVVIPVYDVEQYLGECLDSLLAQSYASFEAIVVIDGATDGSPAIAERYAGRDRRIRVIRQANAGLGAARNVGMGAARGDFLAFLDADDRLPPDAYANMVNTILRTGSDLVVGALQRGEGDQHQVLPLMRQNHHTRRESVSLAEMPLMLADVFAVNKVFRRSFWNEHRLTFPEDLLYEDQPALTRAFLAADRFDVLPETVYHWRVRGDRTSITQARHELSDLLDRVRSKRMSTRLVERARAPHLADAWYKDILPVDMWEYFRAVPDCSDDYWYELQAAVREFWTPSTTPFEETRVPVQQRLMGWLVGQGRRAELERLIDFLDSRGGHVPTEARGDQLVAQLPGVDDPAAGVPDAAYVLGEHEKRLRTNQG